jgi:hypothetical protein
LKAVKTTSASTPAIAPAANNTMSTDTGPPGPDGHRGCSLDVASATARSPLEERMA